LSEWYQTVYCIYCTYITAIAEDWIQSYITSVIEDIHVLLLQVLNKISCNTIIQQITSCV